jgi:hypothetical protein
MRSDICNIFQAEEEHGSGDLQFKSADSRYDCSLAASGVTDVEDNSSGDGEEFSHTSRRRSTYSGGSDYDTDDGSLGTPAMHEKSTNGGISTSSSRISLGASSDGGYGLTSIADVEGEPVPVHLEGRVNSLYHE